MNKTHFRVGLVKVPVSDLVLATRFYRDVLGLEEEFVVEAYGWAQYRTGNLPLCLYVPGKGGGDGTPGQEVGVHLQVNDLAELRDQVIARGGDADEIVESDDGGAFMLLRDPDSNQIKIVQGYED